MGNRLPKIFTGSRICIICDGDEEYEYLEKLMSLDVWSKEYCFQLENAGGNGNIPARYQDKYQNGAYDIEGYKGREEQRKELFSQITEENYQKMRERIKQLSFDDAVEGSTNFGRFLEWFSSDDNIWIKVINSIFK